MIIDPAIIGRQHYELYLQAETIIKRYSQLKRIVSIVGEYELATEDQIYYHRAKKILNYMTQSLYVTADQTGRPGVYVPRAKTIADVAAIVSGKLDKVNEDSFNYIGDLSTLKNAKS